MGKYKNRILATVVIIGIVLVIYVLLEVFFYNDIGCICAVGYFPMLDSRLTGYGLLVISTILFIVSYWRVRNLSRWCIVPALIVFSLAFYGNGHALYTQPCSGSLYRTTFFIHKTKLGDFAQISNAGGLDTGIHNGRFLGYSFDGKELLLYKIGESPLKVNTSFLFWKVRPGIFVHDLPGLFRNLEYEKNNDGYEFIGGRELPVEVFRLFISRTKDFDIRRLKNQIVINENDGTTRFRFEQH